MFAVALFLAAAFFVTYSEPNESDAANGVFASGAVWDLTGDTLTITGPGAMDDFLVQGAPWFGDGADVTSVVIGSGVTTIGNNAFEGCLNLTSVVIPSSVTTIGENAFRGCVRLTTIDISNVTSIYEHAFYGCLSLISVDLSNVTSLYNGAFTACESLRSVTMPSNITFIGDRMFIGCISLTSIDFSNVIAIGQEAFSRTGLISADLSNMQHIGERAFAECYSLISVDLSNMQSIGRDAFGNCTSLTSVDLSNVGYIGEGAFKACFSLASVVIPSSVTVINEYTFASCISLESIVIPDTVVIGTYAFADCDVLTSVTAVMAVTPQGGIYIDPFGLISEYFIPTRTWVLPDAPKAVTSLTFGIQSTDFDPNSNIAGDVGRVLHYTDADFAWDAGTSSWVVAACSVSGHLTVNGGASNANVTVSLAGYAALTDSNGDYTIAVPLGTSGGIGAAIAGYHPSVFASVTSISGNESGKDITLDIDMFSVSGSVTVNGSPGVNIPVSLVGYTALTDSYGSYIILNVPYGTSGSITAAAAGYAQVSIPSVTLTSGNATNQDILLVSGPLIFGHLTVNGGTASNVGVMVVLFPSGFALTDGNGNYTIAVPLGTSGNITASIPGYTQTGTASVTSISGNESGKDITLDIDIFSVYGRLTVVGGASNVGVTVSLGAYTAVTDASGDYTITGVPYGTSGNITASVPGYVQTVTLNVAPLTYHLFNQNLRFLPGFSVSGNLAVNGGASNANVTVSLAGYAALTDGSGDYIIAVRPGTSGSITASIAGYTQTGTASVTSISGNESGKDIALTLNAYVY
ncbi:MAG: leucine-rich repeat protein, partial [Candidatus Methanoplasma sp.]|nr:leucine-rich repeat protein [Candidatus Methanoplasma sp.]